LQVADFVKLLIFTSSKSFLKGKFIWKNNMIIVSLYQNIILYLQLQFTVFTNNGKQ